MRREKKYYVIAWILAVAIFNAIVFLLPDKILNPSETRFWVIYVIMMVSFIGQFACCMLYASRDKKQERFLLVPIVVMSYSALLVTFLLALQAVIFSFLPEAVTIIISILVLAYYVFAILRSLAAADMVMDVEKRVKEQTKSMTTLIARAKVLEETASEELRPLAKKIHEELRYSDPVSNATVQPLDEQLHELFEGYASAVRENREADAKREADVFYALLRERNEVCKRNK